MTPRSGPGEMYRPFRPRAARWVSTTMAVLVLAMMVAIALLLPSGAADPWSTVPDRLGIVGFGVLCAWFLLRQAGVRADPDPDGLTVRNLVVRRRLAWAEVVSVRFGSGRPWVQLDLADGETLAVMGIQRADGALARAEARRLATLVARHSATTQDD